jgi:hypothetical protein
LSSPLLKCAACYSRRTFHSRSLPKPLEGDHEVQVTALYVEPFARRRTEQVKALDAVATADLTYLLNPVFDERNHGFTLLQTACLSAYARRWRV